MHFFQRLDSCPLSKGVSHFSIKLHVMVSKTCLCTTSTVEEIRKVEHIQKSRGGGSSSGRRIVAAPLEKHIIRVRGKSETSLSLAC